MPNKHKTCPYPGCHGKGSISAIPLSGWQIHCVDCGTRGPTARTQDDARAMWDRLPRPAKAIAIVGAKPVDWLIKNGAPLEELGRQLSGKPIFVAVVATQELVNWIDDRLTPGANRTVGADKTSLRVTCSAIGEAVDAAR